MLTCTHFFNVGEVYTLHMYFTAGLNRPERIGFFVGQYNKTPRELYGVTRLSPDYAHYAFPCFQNPRYRTPFNITLVHNQKYVALSNMPAIKLTPHAEINDYVWTTFMQTPPLPTHMVMWTLHRLQKVATGGNVTVWARPHLTEKLSKAAELTTKLLRSYETLLNRPLSGKIDWGGSYDHVVLPEYTDVDSSKGLLIYGEGEVTSSDKGPEDMQAMLAELLARQWNGVLVGAAESETSYVSDGLNYYLALHVMAMENKDTLKMAHLLTTRLDVMHYDSLDDTMALKTDSRSSRHQKLRKDKMCLLIHMISSAVGKKVFFEGLQDFFHKWSGSAATTKQLWEQFQKAGRRGHQLPAGIDLTTVMDSWLNQPGYPLLTVLRDDQSNTVTTIQSRYYQGKSPPNGKECWWLPVIYITKSVELYQVEWLGCGKRNKPNELKLTNVPKPNEWLLVNTGAAAPVRVLYDMDNWQLISEALLHDHNQIPEAGRAQLVDDALALAWSGQMEYNTSIGVIKYLKSETSVSVWQMAIKNFEKIHNIMRLSTGYRIFKVFMQQLVEPTFKTTVKSLSSKARTNPETPSDPESKSSESETNNKLPGIIYRLACQFDIEDCVTDAQNLYKSAINQKSSSSIPEDIREIVLCRGIRNNLEKDWITVRDMYLEATEEKEKGILLRSLSCTTEYWAVQKLLNWALDENKVPKSLVVGLFTAVLRTPLGHHLGTQFLNDQMEEILRSFSNKEVQDILTPFIDEVTTKDEYYALKAVFKNKMSYTLFSSLSNMLDLSWDKVTWRKKQYLEFLKAIRSNTLEANPKPENE
ncbi:thyrotropin-releasing hormone-degrading ectoenzyme [Drosophila ficusphila]|uniref:thyrotropin-releasing hormone-degrading ectoenzyme n=1 Tax=Drosophila ficusphila TaxID=30025 RepID=UPI001C8A8DC3|nr:thyrotropin-releasing hormone-degrading ectoenzyme [Drosophila ficusphila]